MSRLFRLAAAARGPLTLTVTAVLVATGAAIAQMLVAAHLVAGSFGEPRPESTLWRDVGPTLLLLLSIVGVRAVAVGVIEGAGQRLATRVKSRIRQDAVAHLIARGRQTDRERTGELVTTVVDGVEKLDGFYRRFVPQAMMTAITPVTIVIAVAFIDFTSALLLALTAPLIPLFMWLLGSAAQRRSREQWQALTHLGGRFLDTLQGLPTLTAFGRSAEAALAVNDANEALRVRTMSVLRLAFLSGFVLELAASMSTAIVAASIGVRLIEGWMTFSAGLAVLLLTPEFFLPFRQLAQRHHAGMEGIAAGERIFALLDSGEHARPHSPWPLIPHDVPALSVESMTHTYPQSDAPAIENVSVTFAPRTVTAIVGESGAGKSTFLNLLLRLLEPTHGHMRIDGRDHHAFAPAAWRAHFAFVPQRPRFMHGSIAENLRLARADASAADVSAAARLAHLDETIRRLPDGYDTLIDDTAASLSGGERQRLAIARALLKQAPILILDEPTSGVDAQTEALLNDTLTRVGRERTVIVATHRLDIVRHADQILRFADGRVAVSTPVREVA